MLKSHLKNILIGLVAFGALAKFYDISAPWKRKDHYNYGGSHTQQMVNCMRQVPFAESRGVPLYECEPGNFHYYTNHPPTIIFLVDAFTKVFGELKEWNLRLFSILFSLLNLWLVFSLAKRYRPEDDLFAWFAAAIYSLYFFGMYYGSHLDFISEFALTPILVSSLFMLKGNANAAGFFSLIAGVFSWPGFLNFAALGAYALLTKKNRIVIIVWGVLAFTAALAMMMWLQNSYDLVDFLRRKLVNQGYLNETEQVWYYPILWLGKFIQYQSKNFGPALALILVFELFFKFLKRDWSVYSRNYFLLIAGGGLAYVILGRNMFYVHSFLYIYLMPAAAILSADFLLRVKNRTLQITVNKNQKILLWFATLILVALYPYGALKTNAILDGATSIVLLITAIFATKWFIGNQLNIKKGLLLLALTGLANTSQMINVRNEAPTDFEFCKKAREEFSKTGQPVKAPPETSNHYVRRLYCKGIPIID